MSEEEKKMPASPEFVRTLLDSMPLVIFVVDADFTIIHLNAAAREFVRSSLDGIFMKRGGTALRCLHSMEQPEGCGRSESCRDCIIREAVNQAVRGGRVHRRQARLRIMGEGKDTEVYYLVTSAPFLHEGKPLALLMLEDISELIRLEALLPICAACKKIRDENKCWHTLEEYLESRIEVEFTHGMCPECLEKWYPEEE